MARTRIDPVKDGLRGAITSLVALALVGTTFANSSESVPTRKIREVRIETGKGHTSSKADLTFQSPEERHQLIVTAKMKGGKARDMTRSVTYSSSPKGVVAVNSEGVLSPLDSGQAEVIAQASEGKRDSITVRVQNAEDPGTVSFPSDVMPILTKLGCNSGGCHGAADGQNGFKLSLFGFQPEEDYEHLVLESRGRRIFPAAPEKSLLIQKPTAAVPHNGGQLIDKGSQFYQVLCRWIEQGMPYQPKEEPSTLESVDVYPDRRTMQPGWGQELRVTAHYSDGSTRDVTHLAQYEAKNEKQAEVSESGHVEVKSFTGQTTVMVRFRAKVDVFRAIVPLGAPVEDLPPRNNVVDKHIFNKLKELGVPPSPVSEDSTFIRRVTLDITGRLPEPAEVRRFVASEKPNKRAELIDRLLESGAYADHFANKWTAILRNKRQKKSEARATFSFHSWIRQSFYNNKPYDEFVSELLTATGSLQRNPAVGWYREVDQRGEQVQDSARLFLGTRLRCARCHHHPFEKWSQQDYYGFAAFFSQLDYKKPKRPTEQAVVHQVGTASAVNPRTESTVRPTPLGAKPLKVDPSKDPRQELVKWLNEGGKSRFARMLVNRYWKHFFGQGLVEPVDDMRQTNPATHPKLLRALADRFIESGYDLKELIRTLCRSTTYQLSSEVIEHNRGDEQNFSRYYPKRLKAEVLLEAVDRMTGTNTRFPGLPSSTTAMALPDNSYNDKSYFLAVFGRPDMSSACECERNQNVTMGQTLHLLNSDKIQKKLASPDGRAAKLAKSDRAREAKIKRLYRVGYARAPSKEELDVARKYLESHANDIKGAYEDLIWSIINSKEFLFNH